MPPVESFDPTNGAVVLRLICALFFLPHMYFKAVGNPPPALAVFTAAGYPRPQVWMRFALVVELIASTLLFLDILTPYVALLCAAMLGVAAGSLFFVNGKKWIWLWPRNGKEYPVFWALCCVALAMLYWQ